MAVPTAERKVETMAVHLAAHWDVKLAASMAAEMVYS
jgi:hypothetical protein